MTKVTAEQLPPPEILVESQLPRQDPNAREDCGNLERTCFGFCHVLTAATVIGVCEIVGFSIMIFQPLGSFHSYAKYMQPVYIFMAAAMFPLILVAIIMLLAIKYRKPCLVMPHLVMQVLVILHCLVLSVFTVVMERRKSMPTGRYLPLFFVPGVVEAMCLYSIIRAYQYLKHHPYEKNNNTATANPKDEEQGKRRVFSVRRSHRMKKPSIV